MNKEYLATKAALCSELAQEQMVNGEGEEAVKNLKRMIRALEEINLINYLDERKRARVSNLLSTCKRCLSDFPADELVWGDKGGHYWVCAKCYKEDK